MLFKAAIALLIIWLLGMFSVYSGGDSPHIFLLVALMPFLVALLKARDTAIRPPGSLTDK